MTPDRYQPPPNVPGALRLHLNENTGGCSPAVLDAVRQVTAAEISAYPDYSNLMSECAAYVGVEESRVALVNGLDEGVLSTIVAAFRRNEPDSGIPEGIVVLPAFEMYAIQICSAGGRVVSVPSRADFEFPFEELLQAVTPETKIILLTNPNNPTGLLISRDAIRRIARAVSPDVTVVVDEAYFEFSGETFVHEMSDYPNVIVGRTFAKAHGLAGLRAGCLIGDPDRLDPVRDVIPPYSVSVLTAAGWRAALKDRTHLAAYQDEVGESKALIYGFCDRRGLKYWRSAGNFVLIRIGQDTGTFVAAMATRNILIKDRSSEHGCEGCIRLTAGLVSHTQQALAAMEEILCAGQ